MDRGLRPIPELRRANPILLCAALLCAALARPGIAQKAAASGRVLASSAPHPEHALPPGFTSNFAEPPSDARPMMRWWWFGPSVVDEELDRELHAMRDAGIGGVEIQPVYPLSLDDPAKGIKNLAYLSPEFLRSVRFANLAARSLGLRVDITLGSGWPYGGPGTTLERSAGCLKLVALPANGPSMNLPTAPEAENLIAAFTAPGTPERWSAAGARQIPLASGATSVGIPKSVDATALLLFYASHTRQQVKRPSVGAEGFVLDHFSRASIDEHLRGVADKLASAFGSKPPYAVFSDSLEVYASDWTDDLPSEFQRRRGYDLVPHLAELYAGGTADAAAIRNDWGRTLSDLIGENYLTPINDWARGHGTLFRSQTYGEPAVTLADEAIPSLPEGEGPQWRQFSFTRWASSASHLYRRAVTSAETFTWLHSPVFAATPLDMKVEADRMFLSGVNQIVGHGWPYTPPSVPYPGWNLYAAAVFDDHNPWIAVMPDVSRYMQRASWLLRQGQPANDVAILLPEDDAQSDFTPGHVSITDGMKRRITPGLMRAILDAGYNLDYIDAATIDRLGGVPYPVLVLPSTDRIPLSTARRLAAYAARGGHIVAVGDIPKLAPGLENHADSTLVDAVMRGIFAPPSAAMATSLTALPEALHKALPPDLVAAPLPDPVITGNDPDSGFGFIHRVLGGSSKADIYFVVNSSNAPLSTTLRFRARHTLIRSFSLDSGKELSERPGTLPVTVTLEPYESRVFVLTEGNATPGGSAPSPTVAVRVLPLGGGWTIGFPDSPVTPLQEFVPWNTLAGRRFYSGGATYRRKLHLRTRPARGTKVLLDFGTGISASDLRPAGSAGIRALLDQPIRDAAIVSVNGRRAGSIWHPPYAIDIGGLLERGANTIEVRVYNTAVNSLAGQPPQDDSALNARYGKRFEPQDMDQIRPLPSGLLSTPTLRLERRPVR